MNFRNVGALAELFDTSCIATRNTALFDAIPEIAITAWEAAPAHLTIAEVIAKLHMSKNPEIFGKEISDPSFECTKSDSKYCFFQKKKLAQHYFVSNPNGTLTPKWDATSQGALAGNPNAFVLATKVSQAVAPGPTGSQNIDWVSLDGIAGQLGQQVYRTNTQLGQPPASVSSSFVNPSWTRNTERDSFFFSNY
jgi:hypothetical protein